MNILEFKDGKCSSLDELYNISSKLNFNIANGFATTITMYDDYMSHNKLTDLLQIILTNLDTASYMVKSNISDISNTIKTKIINGKFTPEQRNDIKLHYNKLCKEYNSRQINTEDLNRNYIIDKQNQYFKDKNYEDHL